MSWTTLAETGTPNNDHLTRGEGSRQPGGAQVDQGIGVSSFIAALSSGFAIFMLQLLLFLLLRNKLGRIFNEPKTKQRTRLNKPDVRSLSLISSIKLSWNSSDSDIARDCGLDAYFFLRYLRTLLLAFFPIATLVIPVLIPLNYVDGRGHQLDADGRAAKDHDNAQVTGLDTLAWGNIRPSNAHRYWAHLVISILTIAWVCALFFYEMRAYIEIRQTHLTSADHRSRPSAATILVDSIPDEMCTDSELRKLFNHFPGGVKNIWINRDFSLLLQLIDRRDAIVQQLEVAETTLIRNAHHAHQSRWNRGKAGDWRRLFRGNSKSTGIQDTIGKRSDPREFSSTDCEKDSSGGLREKYLTSIKELATNVRGVQQASVVVNILAQNLPKASNYFFSYMVLQSFSTSAATLLQVGSLISHYIVAPMFDVSPRDKWFRKMKPHSVKWGSVFPVYTNFACIALIYCIISPLISVFAILTFGLIWLAQRYAILNFYRSDHDTGGVLYPRALNQTFTGVYVMELCLTGLFFMAKDEKANAVCTAHAIIMAIALVATVLFQAFLNWRFAPLFRFLPVDLGNDEVTMTGQKKQVKDDLQLQQMMLEDVSNMDERNEVSEDLRTNTTNKLSTEFPTTLGEVPINKRAILVNEAFKHYALTVRQPIIWIPRNGLHVSKDEIDQCKQISGSIDMSNDGAYLDDHGRVVCYDKPPDFSEFAYVKL
ncbi:Calcium permeable stress-gated cation channel 1, N-terminal transmembrane domain [Fusarium oxysporum f. sp. vasinfectum]|nr:Calcium permeable stress-gated cation channel 1, N-terminal transmembrane domain [Fusarium oxysporum f. sp. vasinfectum]